MTHGIIYLWLIVGFLFLAGAYLISMNYYHWIYPWLTRKKASSPLPLLGGLLCPLAMRVAPIAGGRAWAWIPWVLDPRCVFLAGVFIFTAIVTKGFKPPPPNQRPPAAS